MKAVWLTILSLVLTGAALAQSTATEYVSLRGRTFYLAGKPFYPVAINYGIDTVYDSNNVDFIAPHHSYALTNLYPCTTQTTCYNAVVSQLQQIKSWGFNTVRIVGLGAGSDCLQNSSTGCTQWSTNLRRLRRDVTNAQGTEVPVTSPYTEMLALIVQALKAARQANLKVILLAGSQRLDDPNIDVQYRAYLQALATALADDATLMAYDFYNEPLYAHAQQHTKQDVCTIVSGWQAAVRAATPRHLTTIGLVNASETMEWDPGILGLDFVSFHPYQGGLEYAYVPNGGDFVAGLERSKNDLYWSSQALRVPWMIGENGLSASPDPLVVDDQGSPAQQKTVAHVMPRYTRDCGGSGYSWWWYRDVHWGGAQGDFYGLATYTGAAKPAAAEFSTFDPWTADPCVKPARYENPYGFTAFHLSGRVKDQNGIGVPRAIVHGWNVTSNGWESSVRAFAGDSGDYDLWSDHPIDVVKATSIGAGTSQLATPGAGTQDFSIVRHMPPATVALDNVSIAGQPPPYEAADYVQSSHFTIANTATVTMKGGNMVRLRTGFVAKKGAMFRAKTGYIYPECSKVDN